jgi:hypothetical protein
MLSVNVWLQHRILGFANGTTAGHLTGLVQHFGICDHQDAASEGRRDVSHFERSQGSMADIRDTITQKSCNKVAVVRQCGELAPGDFHLFGPLKEHLGGQIRQTDVEVQEAVSKWFCSQNYILQADTH